MIRIGLILLTFFAVAALGDDRNLITTQMQALSDAIAAGDVTVWNRYLDPDVIYAEEDGSYKGKAGAVKEIAPLPKGLSGIIKVELLDFHQREDIAVALFRQVETEHYFGQTIHANYLTNTTWRQDKAGWKMIAGQVIAERTDPPAITLPATSLSQYEGTYRLKNSDSVYTLNRAQGRLIGTRDNRKPADWNAEAPDVFFVKGDPRIRKIFQRDASGNITGFIERREMWDIIWLKTSK